MAPEEESKPEETQSDASAPRSTPRRDGRGSRGRRGRGRGRRPKPPQAEEPGKVELKEAGVPGEPEAIFELAEDTGTPMEPAASASEAEEPAPEQTAQPPVVAPSQPASPASVEQAIDEVSGIIDSLRSALDDMEEVLEMLEMYERQKNADEREIDSLRRALRQMHRPRDGGHHPHR